MVMLDNGELMFPAAAGPIRGPRYARLLVEARSAALAARSVRVQDAPSARRPTDLDEPPRRARLLASS